MKKILIARSFAENHIHSVGGMWALVLLCGFFMACDSVDEKYTRGTLVIQLQASETLSPVADKEVVLFDETQSEEGLPYRTDGQGRVEHHWGWLGGGGQYTVRLVIADTAYVAVDTTKTFAIRGTKEDNYLEWLLVISRRGTE